MKVYLSFEDTDSGVMVRFEGLGEEPPEVLPSSVIMAYSVFCSIINDTNSEEQHTVIH